MKIAIVGSRSYPRPDVLANLFEDGLIAPDTVVVSGGAHGPDAWAAHVAEVYGLPEPIVHKPDFAKHGSPAAYFVRNTLIAQDCDALIAFWDGASGGTLDTMKKAAKLWKPIAILGVPAS